MSVSVFGVTHTTVRGQYFPAIGSFTANTNPTSTVVASIIDQKAASLEAALAQENISTASITDSASAPYLWCQETLSLMVAVRLLQIITGVDPEVAKSWREELKARLDLLDERGAIALGDVSLDTGNSPANGATTHISHFSLDLPESDDLSSLEPLFRKDDLL